MKQSYTKLLPRNRALHGHLHLSFILNAIWWFVVRGGGGGRRFLCTYSTVVQICCTCADVQ